MKTVTVFGSGRCGRETREYSLARELGGTLASAGYVICNGGFGGTMEATARGAKEAGGTTVGVTVSLFGLNANDWIDREIRTDTLPERLLKLIELGDAYVILPGATGTLLELAAVWELSNKNIVPVRPVIVFGSFWHPLVRMIHTRLSLEHPSGGFTTVHEVDRVDQCLLEISRALGPGDRGSSPSPPASSS